MNKPDVVHLGPGYTMAMRVGRRTVFYDEARTLQPKVMEADGRLRLMTERDATALKDAAEKRRTRRERNLSREGREGTRV